MSRDDARTLAGTAGVLLLAGVLRLAAESLAPPVRVGADTVDLADHEAASARALDESEHRSSPLAPGESIDVNEATEVELDRLPGVGPSVAEALVRSREAEGPFEGPSDLTRVRGIGSATAGRIAERVTFGRSGHARARQPGQSAWSREAGEGGGPPSGGQAPPPREAAPALDLNRATEGELVGVKGIGPVLARRIVEMRDQVGRFRRVDDLIDVRGIGPAKLRDLREQLVVRR